MRKFWGALLAVMMATGFACVTASAAGEGDQPPPPPEAATRPPAPPGDAADRQVEMIRQMIVRWESVLGRARTDEAKKLLNEAIGKGKELQSTLEKRTAALRAGQDDVVRNMAGEVQEQYTALSKYLVIVPVFLEIDRTKAMQDEQGKDNPELSAHCQKVIDLLNKKLELQTQLLGLENDLNKERQALAQPVRGMPGMPPAMPPRGAPMPPPEAK